MSLLSRAVTAAGAPRTVRLLPLVATLLLAPTLGMGLGLDDWMMRACLEGTAPAGCRPVMDLFSFLPAPGPVRDHLAAQGALGWWVDAGTRATFFRPLAALTHVLDHALWPRRPWLAHLHSLLWMAATVAVVTAFYRQLHRGIVGPVAAGLAAFLFAVDEAHVMVAGWLAGRNGLVGLVFGLLAVRLHVAARTGGSRDQALAAPALLALALAAGESALGAVVLLLAWEATLGPGSRGRRLAALAPAMGVVVAWRALSTTLGYGVVGSALYVDPAADPVRFVEALVQRWPAYVIGLWSPLTLGPWAVLPAGPRWGVASVGLLLAFALLVLFRPLLRASPLARFYALSSALALVPVSGAFPMERLTLWASLGAFGLLGLAAEAGWATAATAWRRGGTIALLLTHGALAPLATPLQAVAMAGLFRVFATGQEGIPREAGEPGRTLVWVDGTDLGLLGLAASQAGAVALDGRVRPVPERVVMLGSIFSRFELERRDARTLRLTAPGGLFRVPMEGLFRHPDRRFFAGETLPGPRSEVRVVAVTGDGRPEIVDVVFATPLEDPEWTWWSTATGAFTPPPVGERRELALVPGG